METSKVNLYDDVEVARLKEEELWKAYKKASDEYDEKSKIYDELWRIANCSESIERCNNAYVEHKLKSLGTAVIEALDKHDAASKEYREAYKKQRDLEKLNDQWFNYKIDTFIKKHCQSEPKQGLLIKMSFNN